MRSTYVCVSILFLFSVDFHSPVVIKASVVWCKSSITRNIECDIWSFSGVSLSVVQTEIWTCATKQKVGHRRFHMPELHSILQVSKSIRTAEVFPVVSCLKGRPCTLLIQAFRNNNNFGGEKSKTSNKCKQTQKNN